LEERRQKRTWMHMDTGLERLREEEEDEQGEGKHANTAMQGQTARSNIADVERRTRTGIMSLAWLCISAVNRVASCGVLLTQFAGPLVHCQPVHVHHFGLWALRSRHRQLDDRQ